MFPGFDLSKLPSLSLSQRNSLPECPAVYFAVDLKNRVLYVGKATNLLARWKSYHRQEQLNRINRKTQIKIYFLSCYNDLKLLAITEIYFIEFYQPLLNLTPVPAKKITPTKTVLQQTLSKLAELDVVVFGFEPAMDSFPTNVYLKYFIHIYKEQFISNTGPVNNIIQANNKRRAAKLNWREYKRERFNQSKVRSWKTGCNGVNIELSPWKAGEKGYLSFRPQLGKNVVILAGCENTLLSPRDHRTT